MKTIIFFLLVGVSVAQDLTKNNECVTKGLKSIPNFLQKSMKFCCAYRGDINNPNSYRNYEDAGKSYVTMLKNMGCPADAILGQGQTFENLAQCTGEQLVVLFKGLVINLLEAFHISEATFGLICKVLGNTLASQCLEKLLADHSVAVLTKINNQLCKADPNVLSADDMIVILVTLACVGDDALGCQDNLKTVAGNAAVEIKGMLQNALVTLQKTAVTLSGITAPLCTVLKTLLSKNPLSGGLGPLI